MSTRAEKVASAPVRKALPWVAAVLLLGVVLLRVDLAATRRALADADWPRFVLAAVPFAGIWWLVDAAALSRLVSRFHARIDFGSMLRLRGATYLLLVLSYDAAQAALALVLSRQLGVPLLALGGTFLFYYGIDLATIAALGSAGAGALPGALGEALRPVLALIFAGVATALTLGAWLARRPDEKRPRFLRGVRVLETLSAAGLRDALELAGWRTVFYGTFIGFSAATLPAFGIHVPLAALVACVPVTLSIAALPITVSGLGSAQVAMLALYGSFADEPRIVAYSLAYSASLVLLRLPIGLALWPAVMGTASAASEPLTSRNET